MQNPSYGARSHCAVTVTASIATGRSDGARRGFFSRDRRTAQTCGALSSGARGSESRDGLVDVFEGIERAQVVTAMPVHDKYIARVRGYEAAGSFPDILHRIARSVGPLRTDLATTHWNSNHASGGSPRNPGNGQIAISSLSDFAAWLRACATEFRTKDASRTFAHGLSRWGGPTDKEVVRIDWLWADCDARGEWFVLRAALDACGIAYVASRSGGDAPGKPKWHIHFPLAWPLVPPAPAPDADPLAGNGPAYDRWKEHDVAIRTWKARWHDESCWIFGVLAKIAGLAFDGFDRTLSDSLFHRSYPAARRHELAQPAEVVHRDGNALDWYTLLRETGYTPTPAAEYRKPKDVDPEVGTAWHAALAHDGYIVDEQADGKYVLRCPWEHEHSAPGGKGTVLFPDGTFHCSHEHCADRRNRDVLEKLSPEARTFIEGANETAGVKRLRDRLAEHEPRGEMVSLDTLATRIEEIVRGHKPGATTVIVAPPGSGKNRALNECIPKHHLGAVIVAPNHDLAAQHAADLYTIAKVQHRKGVLRQVDAEGKPLCTQFRTASRLQAAGADVSSVVCRGCPDHKGCKAIAATRKDADAPYVVTVPQLARSARESVARILGNVPVESVLTVYDESVAFFEAVQLSPEELQHTVNVLDHDETVAKGRRLFDAYKLEPIRALARVLCAQRGGALSAQAACDLAPTTLQRLPRMPGRPPLPETLERICGQYVRDPIGMEAALEPNSKAVWNVDPDYLATVIRVVLALAELARAIDHNGVNAIEWVAGTLRIRSRTVAARDITENGGIITDATPKEHEILAMARHRAVFHRFDVPDNVPVTREVVYRSKASRRTLLTKEKQPSWDSVLPLLRAAVAKVQAAGCARALLVTYRPIHLAIRNGTDEGSEAARQILAGAGFEYDLAHYGAVRGLNRWLHFDCCVTIGDPWGDIGVDASDIREVCRLLGYEPTPAEIDSTMRDAGEDELLQCHERIRTRSRKTQAWQFHFGSGMVPTGWTVATATASDADAGGRPKMSGSVTIAELREWVDALGGTAKAASKLGVDRKTVQRYLNGSRALPNRSVLERKEGAS